MGGDCGFPTVTSHPWDSPGVLFQQLTKTPMLTATPPACSPVPAPAPRAERAWALDSGQTLPSDPMAKPGLRVSGGQGQEKSGPSQALDDSGEGPLPWSCRAGVTWGWTAPRGREWGGPTWHGQEAVLGTQEQLGWSSVVSSPVATGNPPM